MARRRKKVDRARYTWSRAGVFKDLDVVLHWHPGGGNSVNDGGMLAVVSAKFTFHGVAAHAAMSPDRGRSALDAVMLMGNGIEFMREHVPSNTRMHYIISKGGVAPNIVPDLAQMDLMARSPSNTMLKGHLGSDSQGGAGRGPDDGNHPRSERHWQRRQHCAQRCAGTRRAEEPGRSGRIQNGCRAAEVRA